MLLPRLWAGLILGLLACCAPGCTTAQPSLGVEHSCILDNELRLNISTCISHYGADIRYLTDVEGYYVAVNLKNDGPLEKRARIIGPLEQINNSEPKTSYSRFFFDPQNNFIFEKDLGSRKEIYRLGFDSEKPRWVMETDPDLVNILGGHFFPSVLTASGQRELTGANNTIRLYDTQTGRIVPDPWLEQVYAEYLLHPDILGHVWLADDLSHLIVVRQPKNSRSILDYHRPNTSYVVASESHLNLPPRDEVDITQFKTIDERVKYAEKMRQTPEWKEEARLVSRFIDAGPVGVCLVNNEPLLLNTEDDVAKLSTLDGLVRYSIKITNQAIGERVVVNPSVYLQSKNNRVIFVRYDYMRHLIIAIWNYIDGTIEYQQLNLEDLFKVARGQYHPVTTEPLATAKP